MPSGFIIAVPPVIGWLSFFLVGGAMLLPVVQQLDILPHTFDTGGNLLGSFQLLSCFGDLFGQFILFRVESLALGRVTAAAQSVTALGASGLQIAQFLLLLRCKSGYVLRGIQRIPFQKMQLLFNFRQRR